MQCRHTRKLIPAKFLEIVIFEKACTERTCFLINNTKNVPLLTFLLVEVTKIRKNVTQKS